MTRWALGVALGLACGACGKSAAPPSIFDGQVVAKASPGAPSKVTYTTKDGQTLTVRATAGDVLVIARPQASQGAITSALAKGSVTLEAALPAVGVYLFQTAPGSEAALVSAANADANVRSASPNLVGKLHAAQCFKSVGATIINGTTNLAGAFNCTTTRGHTQVIAIDAFQNGLINKLPCVSHGEEVTCILTDESQGGGPTCAMDVDDGDGSADQFSIDLALAAALNTAAANAAKSPPIFTAVNISMGGDEPCVLAGGTGVDCTDDAGNAGKIDVAATRASEKDFLEHVAGMVEAFMRIYPNTAPFFGITVAAGNASVDLSGVVGEVRGEYGTGMSYVLPAVATDAQGNLAGYSDSVPGGARACATGDTACNGYFAQGTSFASPRVVNILAAAADAYIRAHPGTKFTGAQLQQALLDAQGTACLAPAPADVEVALEKLVSGGGGGETWSGNFQGDVTDGLDCLLSSTNANWTLSGTLTITTSGPLASGGITSSITFVATQALVNGYDQGSCTAHPVSYTYGGAGQEIRVAGGTITVDFSSNGGGTLTGTELPSNGGAVTGGGPPTVGGLPMCDPVVGNPVLVGAVSGSTYSGNWSAGNSAGAGFGTSKGTGTFSLTRR